MASVYPREMGGVEMAREDREMGGAEMVRGDMEEKESDEASSGMFVYCPFRTISSHVFATNIHIYSIIMVLVRIRLRLKTIKSATLTKP